ncbi:hypothetical protein MKX01_008511 [Papaver californicum]|nr:hypothetical protein MKX01_008511 [Papaver californicum]
MAAPAGLVVIGISVGVAIGLLLAVCSFFGLRWYRKCSHLRQHSTARSSVSSLPILNISDMPAVITPRSWWNHQNKDAFASNSSIPNFLFLDPPSSFGPVYKATMATNEVVAVKSASVHLLGRLHHRNLVNLVGYCVDKGQHIVVFIHLGEGEKVLSWEQRLQVALDISHGIEYLHEGAVPPVIHRDLKSGNILLDRSMGSKVADFGLSKEEVFDGRKSGLKGIYGYMDPDYISSSRLTKKSDVYSFGIIIFELITGIHPQQNLLEYVNLAGMSSDGVDEILDKHIVGKCNIEEVRLLASIGHKCIHKTLRRRPSIADVSQAISRIRRRCLTKEDTCQCLL